MQRFIIVVDMQRDFVASDGALPVTGAEELVGPMQAWLAASRPEEVAGVLFTADTHIPDIYAQSDEAQQFPPHCVRGSPGWAPVLKADAIAPEIPRYRLEKSVFDMWAEGGLTVDGIDRQGSVERDAFFADLHANGIVDVIVVGVAADYCVRWAVEGLIQRGFRVTIPAAMTRGIVRQIDAVASKEWGNAKVSIA
jgi:nicotinamidase/pyrazinamidase